MNLHWKERSVLKLLFFFFLHMPIPDHFYWERVILLEQEGLGCNGRARWWTNLINTSFFYICSVPIISLISSIPNDGRSRWLPPQTFYTISKIPKRNAHIHVDYLDLISHFHSGNCIRSNAIQPCFSGNRKVCLQIHLIMSVLFCLTLATVAYLQEDKSYPVLIYSPSSAQQYASANDDG